MSVQSQQNIPAYPYLQQTDRDLEYIQLTQAGKRFNRDWIFRKLSYTFITGRSYAITGPNGSGKSTLLLAIAGSLQLSEGDLAYRSPQPLSTQAITTANQFIDPEKYYQQISIAAPYLELIEEMTAREFLGFHQQFKPLMDSVTIEEIILMTGLQNAADKQIRYYSSGMKQRLKLAQAIFSNVPVLLLDEPCTNLDAAGYELYHQLISRYALQKLIIVSSNDTKEMDFCTDQLNILDYK